jgi:glycosyltransferase involved in cell wall biosynthesis
MLASPLISIIVPVYNMEEYLVKCLESVCSQTLRDIEIICINDGSTDNSLKILEEFQKNDERIQIITQRNQGLSAARNAGLDVAKGEYIAFVDSDDFISPFMYEDLSKKIIKYNTDIVVCNYFLMNEASVEPRSICSDYYINSEKDYLYDLLKDENIQNYVWSRLYKRKLFKDVRFQVGKVFEDIYLSIDLIGKIKTAYYTSEPHYCYRMREDSITNSLTIKSVKDAIEGEYIRYCKIKNIYPDLLAIGVYSLLKWISIMCDAFGDKKAIFDNFGEIIDSILSDLEKINIEEFKDNYKYYDVLELIKEYKKLQ